MTTKKQARKSVVNINEMIRKAVELTELDIQRKAASRMVSLRQQENPTAFSKIRIQRRSY